MSIVINTDDRIFSKQVDRNLKGVELEKQGLIDKAISLYENNVKEFFVGSHPYDRLAIIYHKRKQFQDEERILKCAIQVFETLLATPRLDVEPKLEKYKAKLIKLGSKELSKV
jgi:hypothetical protein